MNNRTLISEPVAQNENYVRMIAHEIRNPLTAIKMARSFLEEGIRSGKDPEMVEIFLEIVANNASKIEQLIKKLLQIPEDELSLFAPVDVCHLLDNTIASARDRIFLQNVNISRSYTPGFFVNGNAEKLAIAFLNIIINAIESMRQDQGKLWIAVYRTERNVKVVFKDNGSGMPEEVVKQIFDANFTRKREGFGFGLKHVKDILDEHNAVATVISKPGAGTSIVITFSGL